MQVFVRVVETGGFSSAGRALGMAPSSVSRRIGDLEGGLGVRLFHRTTRRLSLTSAGETYYERARLIVSAVEEANLAVTRERAAPSGVLRVTVPASVARRHVAPAVAAFHAEHPGVRVVMSVTDRMADLVDEGWDVAIRAGRLEDSSLIARKVGEARRLLAASPAYLEQAGWPGHPEELLEHACLTFRSHPGSNIWRFQSAAAAVEVRATGPLFADNGKALAAAACAGLGVGSPSRMAGRRGDRPRPAGRGARRPRAGSGDDAPLRRARARSLHAAEGARLHRLPGGTLFPRLRLARARVAGISAGSDREPRAGHARDQGAGP